MMLDDFKTHTVVAPFEGRKVKHLAGMFYDFTLAQITLCGLPTNAMGREPLDVPFDDQSDCQLCAQFHREKPATNLLHTSDSGSILGS